MSVEAVLVHPALGGGEVAETEVQTRRGRVQVEVSANDPHLRSVCWHADIRTAERRPSEELP